MTATPLLGHAHCRETEPIRHARAGQPIVSTTWFRREATATPERPEALLTVPEACAALRVSKWTLYQLIRRRQLSTIKIGARRCVPVASVQALIERLRAEGSAL